MTATGADAGSGQPEQGGLPAVLASVGLKGARELGGPVGTLVEPPFIFRIVFFIIVLIQAQGLLDLFMAPITEHYLGPNMGVNTLLLSQSQKPPCGICTIIIPI